MDIFTRVEEFVTGTLWPEIKTFLDNIVESEVQALLPFAKEAVSELEGDLPLLLTSMSGFAQAAQTIIVSTATKAEAAGVAAAASSVLTAVGSALANVSTTVAAPTAAATSTAG